MKTIGIGIQDFAKIADKNMFYIDKTAFLKEWWENQDSVTLITRKNIAYEHDGLFFLSQSFRLQEVF